jgi:hypothetical protein
MKYVTCLNCGWVHMSVSRAFAEKSVKEFNEYYETLTKRKKIDYYDGKKSNIKDYERCGCGNSYKEFRDSKKGDCPDGCTIGPILDREE